MVPVASAATASPCCEMELEDEAVSAIEGGVLLAPVPFGVESSDDSGEVRRPQLRRTRRAVIAAGLCTALVGSVALLSYRWRVPTARSGDVHETVGLQMFGSFGAAFEGLVKATESVEKLSKTVKNADGTMDSFTKFSDEVNKSNEELTDMLARASERMRKWQSYNATQKAQIRYEMYTKLNITIPTDLLPTANKTDGNPCADDEELYLGLCYKKCSLITKGKFPQRSTAFECCDPESCNKNYDFHLGICKFNNVGGDQVGGGCPHAPGGCLKNEELVHGLCYKKCWILTYKALPYRLGPATCCHIADANQSLPSLLKWLHFSADGCDTNQRYSVGGGGDDIDDSTPSAPHLPLVTLTEGTATSTAAPSLLR